MQTSLALLDFDADTVVMAGLATPQFPVEDLTVHRGEGIFETVLVSVEPESRETKVHSADAHFDRFQQSAAMLDLPAPPRHLFDEAVAGVIAEVVGPLPPSVTEFSVRYAMSRGLDAYADRSAHGAAGAPAGARGWAFPIPVSPAQQAQRADGVRVVTLDRGYDAYLGESAPWLLIGAKTLSYAMNQAASRHAVAQGGDEGLFVSRDGIVLEGPTSNVVIRRGDTLLTPEPRAGLLHGTTQRAVFAGAEASGWSTAYADLTVADVVDADAAWLVSSVRLAVPITELDRTAIAVDPHVTGLMHSWIRSS